MPKTKGQGLVFGILMSVTMAYGMEVYNVALKSGVLQHVGGFSDMRNTVFLGALKEASFMWLFVLLFSNLWGNRLGAKLADKLVSPQRQPVFANAGPFLLYGTGDVPYNEPCGGCVISSHFGPSTGAAIACYVDRYCVEKLSHGAALESVCSRTGKPCAVAADFS